MFQFNPLALLELLAVLLCFVFAVVLYRVGASGSVARKLSLLLVVEGITLLSSGIPFDLLSEEIQEKIFVPTGEGGWLDLVAPIDFIIHTFADCAMLAIYPIFLAAALPTSLTRPFADKRVQLVLFSVTIALFIAVQFSPLEVGAALLYGMLSLGFGFALVASVHAWLIAKPGQARVRAGVFTLAFGLRDICWGFVYGSAIYRIFIGVYMTENDPEYVYHIYRLSTLIYIPIIAYGILRTQLFDIDLRIRWTIKQSTFAAMVVGIVFVLSEGVEWLVSSEMGDTWGLAAAALVVFFLKPLQGFAERVVSRLMPRTQNTPEYKNSRKKMVYESALSEAQQDGVLSKNERALLVRLRDSLGISESDAELIEAGLQAQLAS